jgi:very-short-patch-repair endonuclease
MTTPATTYHATTLEPLVGEALDSLGVAYEREVWIGPYQVGFWLAGPRVAVEARGCVAHAHWRCGLYEPTRVAREERRTRFLTSNGVRAVVPIWYCDLVTYGALEIVRRALTAVGVLPREESDNGDKYDKSATDHQP